MQEGYNQYAPMQGVALLRERIATKVFELYSAGYDPASEITITSGATEALFATITAVVGRQDEVIVFEPAFDSYIPVIELCGGTPVYIQLKKMKHWRQLRKNFAGFNLETSVSGRFKD